MDNKATPEMISTTGPPRTVFYIIRLRHLHCSSVAGARVLLQNGGSETPQELVSTITGQATGDASYLPGDAKQLVGDLQYTNDLTGTGRSSTGGLPSTGGTTGGGQQQPQPQPGQPGPKGPKGRKLQGEGTSSILHAFLG